MHQPCSFDKLWGLSEYKMARQMRGKTFEEHRRCEPCHGGLRGYGAKDMFRTSQEQARHRRCIPKCISEILVI